MIYLSRQDIIDINYFLHEEYGGNYTPPYNIHNEGALGYVVGMIRDDLYFPTIYDKASLLMFNISEGHTFSDGNKRTASFSCIQFLELNFFRLKDVSSEVLINLTLDIASSKFSREEIVYWLKENTEEC